MLMKKIYSFVAAGILLGLSNFAAQADQQPTAVVELFTSQGCSSCPPADKLLSGYAKKDNILALSWHVDYWNYLGWKDTFSKAEFTERQYRYARSFKRRGVYTPQAVVNGRDHAVGSRGDEIKKLMNRYASNGKGLSVDLITTRSDGEIRVSADSNEQDATLWVVYYDKESTVKIQRGENKGRDITYHNVVKDFSMLGMLKGGKIDITLPLKEMQLKGHDACAILLQKTTAQGTPGAIVGATVISGLSNN